MRAYDEALQSAENDYKVAKQTADNGYISTVLVGWNTYNNKVDNLDALFEAAVEQASDSNFDPATFFNNGTSGNQGNVLLVTNKKQPQLPQPAVIPPNDSSVPDFLKPPAANQLPGHQGVGITIVARPDGHVERVTNAIDPQVKAALQKDIVPPELSQAKELQSYIEQKPTELFETPNNIVTPFQLFNEFLTGTGHRSREFKKGDKMLEELRKHWWIQEGKTKAIDAYREYCMNGVAEPLKSIEHHYSYGNNKWRAPYDAIGGIIENEMTTPFLGSYQCTISFRNMILTSRGCILTLEFNIYNDTSNESFMRNPITGYEHGYEGAPNYKVGPRSTISQRFIWEEDVIIIFSDNVPLINP
jgi:RNAse (barnase) inhibitor barstar